jgi:hypothetical protein
MGRPFLRSHRGDYKKANGVSESERRDEGEMAIEKRTNLRAEIDTDDEREGRDEGGSELKTPGDVSDTVRE